MSEYYDKDGKPLNQEEWLALFSNENYRRVGNTTLPDGTWISTVWIGLNHNFMPDTPPLVFETMVFPALTDMTDKDMERYSTLEQAEAGHKAMVKRWSK